MRLAALFLRTMNTERWWRPKRAWVCWTSLLVVGLVTLLPGIFSLPLVDRDEPRFARATVEMAERGNWIVPYFNAEYRFDKPPLTYWWMELHYLLFGISEGAARLHSVFAALGVAAVLFVWGRQLFDPSVGWWSAMAWLTCLQVLMHGRLVLADMPMVLGVTVAQWCLWQILVEQTEARRWWWGLWLSLAFGFFAKGPIAWLVPVLTWAIFRLFLRKRMVSWAWRRLHPGWGVALVLFLVGAWGIPALWLTDGAFWKVGIGKHVVERGFESFNERVYFPFFYFLTIFFSLFPWAGGLPGALCAGWRSGEVKVRFLIAWLLAPILIFLFYKTQLPHYVLPGFGGALLLIFGFGHPARGWFPGVLRGFFLLVAIGLAAFAAAAHPLPSFAFLRGALLGVSLLLAAAVVLAGAPGDRGIGGPLRLAVSVVALGAGFALFAWSVRDAAMSPRLAAATRAPNSEMVLSVGYAEPSLVFYSGRPWAFPHPDELEAEPALLEEASVVVVRQREWRDATLWKAFWRGDAAATPKLAGEAEIRPVGPWEGIPVAGFNFARFSWVEVIVYRPTPS